jgi:OOP family OmpA-OmpF porin
MEVMMVRITSGPKAFVATVALSVLAGCAQPALQAQAPRHDAATSGPELAGAWYQIDFDTSSAEINERGRRVIGSAAYVIANTPDTRLTVIGRTDRVGAPPAHLALSERRAKAVRDALTNAGVPAARIDTSWTGDVRQGAAMQDDAQPHSRVVDITVVKMPM